MNPKAYFNSDEFEIDKERAINLTQERVLRIGIPKKGEPRKFVEFLDYDVENDGRYLYFYSKGSDVLISKESFDLYVIKLRNDLYHLFLSQIVNNKKI